VEKVIEAVGTRQALDTALGAVLDGGVLDETFTLDQTPDAYRAMADRQVLKALIRP
jgi:hypothetical protein